jgi:hypothetical protein
MAYFLVIDRNLPDRLPARRVAAAEFLVNGLCVIEFPTINVNSLGEFYDVLEL